MKFQVNVSEHEIENCERGAPRGCMIQQAFLRATDGLFTPDEVYVDGDKAIGWYIHIYAADRPLNHLMYLHKIPGMERIDYIIEAWDAGYTVEPFSFWIDIPNEAFQPYLLNELKGLSYQQTLRSKGE